MKLLNVSVTHYQIETLQLSLTVKKDHLQDNRDKMPQTQIVNKKFNFL